MGKPNEPLCTSTMYWRLVAVVFETRKNTPLTYGGKIGEIIRNEIIADFTAREIVSDSVGTILLFSQKATQHDDVDVQTLPLSTVYV